MNEIWDNPKYPTIQCVGGSVSTILNCTPHTSYNQHTVPKEQDLSEGFAILLVLCIQHGIETRCPKTTYRVSKTHPDTPLWRCYEGGVGGREWKGRIVKVLVSPC